MSRPKNSFRTLPRPQKEPIRAQKVQNDPKIKSNSKLRIEEHLENNNCSATWVDQKTVFEPYTDPQNSLLEGQKVKNNPKIKSKSKVITNLTHLGPKRLF